MEGDSVTLHMDVTELQRDNVLLWTFGPQDTHIAKINRVHNETFHNGADGRFRDRLKLDSQTGSLTITNVSTELNGLYKVEIIIENKVSSKVFIVKVYAHLPIPVITGYCPQNPPSSVSRCELLCSVVNVSHVTLSWYKGNSLLSSISASDLSNSVSLHLEVEYQDKNSYSCVLNNPISNQTQHLDITQLCQTHSDDYVHYYGFTEAVIRLALSVLVGVAAVAVLLYDVRSRQV
ncbi:natural killer cell receptor 2B4-like [Sinocyclocheilus anshuiensis]|uniref:natural killer cell receptor 2B4-like n=1 Tax=Sinocyclocheilus anshuiensis TaxID=1608454 RepID=UPI0007B78EEA|nr:PREDICTED: natural killer cell receptor 2B4-like [Sinocyclocheilus anshuiensis]